MHVLIPMLQGSFKTIYFYQIFLLSLANGTFYIYQVGWHQGHEEIGVVFQSSQAYNQYNFWESSASCFQESEYSLTLVARGSHMSDDVQGRVKKIKITQI